MEAIQNCNLVKGKIKACIKKKIYLNLTVKAFKRGLAKRVNLLVTLSPYASSVDPSWYYLIILL
jgi:hypothetical protein